MKRNIILILTLILSGRAMTLPYISQAGGTIPGAPPAAWLMPLVGDAIIGLTALLLAYFIWRKKTGLWVWSAIIVWNAVAIWDALSAYIIHTTTPWPDFFMLKLVGPTMFFDAAALHLVIILLAWSPDVRNQFWAAKQPVATLPDCL